MAVARPVPSLSTDGWIYSTPREVDRLLSNYFLSELSQSSFYRIYSLPGQIAKKGNQPKQMQNLVEQELHEYFLRYFPEGVTVNVVINEFDANNRPTSRYEIQVSVIIVVDGVKYSVAQLVSVLDSKIQKIAKLATG